ncbi:MAG: twin-arginine translocase TatA/TatE family subunit [Solirubrobacterales bacterium]|nr:twin-arginine translocase TatA/TatE family subunit [Solirubrobacterales bacterium]
MIGDILQPTHLLLILVVALLVLGPKRLPEVGRTLGNGIRDFKNAINGESQGLREELDFRHWHESTSDSSHEFAHHEQTSSTDSAAHQGSDAHEFAHAEPAMSTSAIPQPSETAIPRPSEPATPPASEPVSPSPATPLVQPDPGAELAPPPVTTGATVSAGADPDGSRQHGSQQEESQPPAESAPGAGGSGS